MRDWRCRCCIERRDLKRIVVGPPELRAPKCPKIAHFSESGEPVGSSEFLLRLEPVVKFRAGLTASLDVELIRPATYAFFKRERFDRGFLCARGCRHGITSGDYGSTDRGRLGCD